MPIRTQASCLIAPASDKDSSCEDSTSENRTGKELPEWPDFPSPDQLAHRKFELQNMMDQAQIMALTISIDISHFSKDGLLAEEMDRLTQQLFSQNIDKGKIKRVFRKLGQRILERDLRKPAIDPAIDDHRLKRYALDRRMPRGMLYSLSDKYPQLRPKFRDIRSWRQLINLVAGLPKAERLHQLVEHAQIPFAVRDLGLSMTSAWNADDEAELSRLLASEDPGHFPDDLPFDLAKNDIVVLKAAYANGLTDCSAFAEGNVITLQPHFFSECMSDDWVASPIVAGETELEHIIAASKSSYLMHELTHTISILESNDQPFRDSELERVENHEFWFGHGPLPQLADIFFEDVEYPSGDDRCYGIGKCKGIVAYDNDHDTTRAEENADSWAIYAFLYNMTIAYPEFDFLSGDHITRREQLLHHCSLLDCLRTSEAGSIRDLPGYNAEQDVWRKEHSEETPRFQDMLLCELRRLIDIYGPSIDDILEEQGVLCQWNEDLFEKEAYNFWINDKWRSPLLERR